MCSSSKQSLNQDALESAPAVDNQNADGSGGVGFGKYIPTKEEVFQHEQVYFRFCTEEYVCIVLVWLT